MPSKCQVRHIHTHSPTNQSPDSFSAQYTWILAKQLVHTSPCMNRNIMKLFYLRLSYFGVRLI